MKFSPTKRMTVRGTGVVFSTGVGWVILIALLAATFITHLWFFLVVLIAFVVLLQRVPDEPPTEENREDD